MQIAFFPLLPPAILRTAEDDADLEKERVLEAVVDIGDNESFSSDTSLAGSEDFSYNTVNSIWEDVPLGSYLCCFINKT